MARGLLRSRLFAFSRFLLLFLLTCQWTTSERTRKAGKGSIERIKRLIDEKARRQFAQSDAVSLPEPAARNPAATRNHDELAVNGQDGEYLQGDLELAEWQAVLLQRHLGQERGSGLWRRKRKVGREPFYKRWDRRRPISFDFADNVPEQTRHTIRQALTLWERETCLRFAEGGPDVDRLEFFDGGGCSSFVGRAGGTQGISIATPGCDFVGIIAHEVGHALGTFHEQARPDQQRHIAVHYNNIPLSRWNNFQPVADDQAATLGLPYDAGSVMHYGPYGFASDQFRPTISTLDRQWQSTIGQRTGPSFLDIQAINQAYGCSDHCAGHAPACLHGGYPHPNDCSRCQCPNGFAGKVCQAVQPSPCGAALQLSTRQLVIATPNHPAPFPPDLDCFWLLKAPPGGHVHLQFFGDQFFYGCDDTCDKTFVELKKGPDFRVTGYRFCCSIAPVDSFRSAGPEMVVIHSAKGLGSAGFKARVWSNLDWPIEPSSVDRPNLVDVDTVEGETVGRKVVETAVTEGWWWWEQASSRKPVVTTSKIAATTSSSSGTTEVRTENASVDMEGSSSSSTTTTQATTTTIIEVEAKSTTAKMETAASTNNAGGDGKTSATIPTTASMSPILPEEEQGREDGSNSNASTSVTPNPEVPVHAISPAPIVVGLTPFPHVNCSCQDWSPWTECSQMCGGCGRRRRLRQCQPGQPLCQLEERRMCNQQSCPQNTNFLFNNGEFHLLWKGCCIGLFLRKDESNSTAISHTSLANQSSALLTGTCGPLDTNDNAFLRILSTLFSSQDGKKRPAANLGNSTQQLLLSRRRTGEH